MWCKAGGWFRHYKVTLVALSADIQHADSDFSNTLWLTTDATERSHQVEARDEMMAVMEGTMTAAGGEEGEEEEDDSALPVRLLSVTDANIHLDWAAYTEPGIVSYYRVVWSSASNAVVSGAP